jgi:hypothetical protein
MGSGLFLILLSACAEVNPRCASRNERDRTEACAMTNPIDPPCNLRVIRRLISNLLPVLSFLVHLDHPTIFRLARVLRSLAFVATISSYVGTNLVLCVEDIVAVPKMRR